MTDFKDVQPTGFVDYKENDDGSFTFQRDDGTTVVATGPAAERKLRKMEREWIRKNAADAKKDREGNKQHYNQRTAQQAKEAQQRRESEGMRTRNEAYRQKVMAEHGREHAEAEKQNDMWRDHDVFREVSQDPDAMYEPGGYGPLDVGPQPPQLAATAAPKYGDPRSLTEISPHHAAASVGMGQSPALFPGIAGAIPAAAGALGAYPVGEAANQAAAVYAQPAASEFDARARGMIGRPPYQALMPRQIRGPGAYQFAHGAAAKAREALSYTSPTARYMYEQQGVSPEEQQALSDWDEYINQLMGE